MCNGVDYLINLLPQQPSDPANRELRSQSWAALEEIYKAGKVRAIGVSNYTLTHLTHLIGQVSVVPHVNQVKFVSSLWWNSLVMCYIASKL